MSRATLEKITVANDAISKEVDLLLRRALSGISLDNPAVATEQLFEVIPPLVNEWGEVASAAAAEWFEELRTAEGVTGAFRADMAPRLPAEQINARLGYATRESGHLYAGNISEFEAFLSLFVNEYVLQPGHQTVMDNAARDKAAFARVPEPGACEFCLMLASRGFVYSRRTVDQTGEGDRFHGGCRCHAMPVWDETRARVVYGYDPDKILERYEEAANNSSRETREVLAQLRKELTR